MTSSSRVRPKPVSTTESESFSLSSLLNEPPKSPGHHMRMDVDPLGPLTLGLAETLPPSIPRLEPTIALSKPNTAAPSSNKPDLSKTSEKELKAWRLSMLDQRRNERNARLRAEEAQRKLDRANLEHEKPLPRTGDKRSCPTDNLSTSVSKPLLVGPNDIINPRIKRCAIRVNGGAIIGNPCSESPGYGLRIIIDSSRDGEPRISLKIGIAKGEKNVALS